MTEIPENVLCLFSADVKEQRDSYVIEVPKQEIEVGAIRENEIYRVAVVSTESTETPSTDGSESEPEGLAPPVEQGEYRTVEIEDIGEKGDGIARVERGYVIIIPDTETNEEVTIKIKEVRQNVAFGEVINREE